MIGRNRFVKPELFTHGLLYDTERTLNARVQQAEVTTSRPAHYPVRLAYIGLWCMSDREGRFEWKPRELKTSLLPYDDGVNFSYILEALRAAGFIAQYAVAGRLFGWVPRFKHHQYVNPQERASMLPPPPIDVVRAWQQSQLAAMMPADAADVALGELGGAPVDSSDSVATASADYASMTGATASFTELGNFALHANEFHGARNLPQTELYEAGSVTSRDGNELRDRQRVGDASGTREARDANACITEQNRTEQNRTLKSEEPRASAPAGAGVSLTETEKGSAQALPRVTGKRTGAALVERLGAVLEEFQTGARRRLSAEQTRKLQAEAVFSYWMAIFGHARALMDAKRERVIMDRLKENSGDVSELLHALDGARNDAWVMGTARNADHKNDGIAYIFASRERVEQFASGRKKYRDGEPHPLAVKYADVIRDAQPIAAQTELVVTVLENLEPGASTDRAGSSSGARGTDGRTTAAVEPVPATRGD